MKLVDESSRVSYIEADKSIICSSLGIIKGDDYSLLVDVGASSKQIDLLNESIKNNRLKDNIKKIVLTHFHPDHLLNLKYFNDVEIIGSKNTSRYAKVTNIIDSPLDLNLGNTNITIFPLPSVHAKGSLGVYVKEDKIMFIGDALCLKEKDGKVYTNKDITMNMIKTIRSYEVNKYILGHEDGTISLNKVNDYLTNIYKICHDSKSTDVFIEDKDYSIF